METDRLCYEPLQKASSAEIQDNRLKYLEIMKANEIAPEATDRPDSGDSFEEFS